MTDDKARSQTLADLRKRAEAKVELDDDLHDMSPDEVRRLVYELRTHQIELEMQNEELRRAQEELAAARDLYSDLYDFAPVGYLTISEQGLILQANLTAADMLGVERGKLIKQRLSAFVVAEDEDTYYLHRRTLKSTRQQQSCELRLKTEDGDPMWGQIVSRLAESTDDSGGLLIRTTLTDITERKELEDQLRHTQKMGAVGQLAAGVAHEFNNLLFGILGSVELIVAEAPRTATRHEGHLLVRLRPRCYRGRCNGGRTHRVHRKASRKRNAVLTHPGCIGRHA